MVVRHSHQVASIAGRGNVTSIAICRVIYVSEHRLDALQSKKFAVGPYQQNKSVILWTYRSRRPSTIKRYAITFPPFVEYRSRAEQTARGLTQNTRSCAGKIVCLHPWLVGSRSGISPLLGLAPLLALFHPVSDPSALSRLRELTSTDFLFRHPFGQRPHLVCFVHFPLPLLRAGSLLRLARRSDIYPLVDLAACVADSVGTFKAVEVSIERYLSRL